MVPLKNVEVTNKSNYSDKHSTQFTKLYALRYEIHYEFLYFQKEFDVMVLLQILQSSLRCLLLMGFLKSS